MVLDLLMPWVNGLEVLATIQGGSRARPTLPVIVVTATPASQSDLQAYAPVLVVRKPFDSEALVGLAQQLSKLDPSGSSSAASS